MSTILKALRRLESDKSSRVQRPLREQVARGAEARRRTPVLVVGIGLFAVGIAIGGAVLLLWPGNVSREASVAQPVQVAGKSDAPGARARPTRRPARPVARRMASRPQEPAAAAAPAEPAPQPQRPSGLEQPTPQPSPPAVARAATGGAPPEPEVAVVRRIEPPPLAVNQGDASAEPRAPRPGEFRPAAEALKPSKRRPAADVASAASAGPASESSVVVPEPAKPEPARPEPVHVASRPAPAPPAPKAARAPKAPETPPPPSAANSAAVPVILVSRTHWHPSAERREALIEVEGDDGTEKRRVREGDSVGPLRVEKIEPSGVVFDYEGSELRHGVGSER